MKLNIAHFTPITSADESTPQLVAIDTDSLVQLLHQEIQAQVKSGKNNIQAVAQRIATEVERICRKSSRIQTSGQIQSWQTTLAKHRLQKCLHYYQLGSKQGRVELHSTLGGMVYRHIAPAGTQLGFQGRYTIIEDFLQSFYIEAIKAFRRENEVLENYSPRTQLELAEYMAFTEQYAKRRINLPGTFNQQLIVLRAQSFARRQPPETTVDIEMAVESARSEEAESHQRSAAVQQVRAQMMSMPTDPGEQCDRERIISELVQYLESEGQTDCVDYLMLKLKDFSAPEIDQMLGLTSRERDYLQQRFKYHMEKFSRTHQWQLVHQWLGADIEHKLGLSSLQWEGFVSQLSAEQQQMLHLKSAKNSDQAIAKTLKCTPKQLQKRWTQLLADAWSIRNSCVEQQAG
jgi:hypothetical protein